MTFIFLKIRAGWLIAGLSCLAWGMGGCSSPAPAAKDRHHESVALMGTIFQLDVCAPSSPSDQAEHVFQEVWDRLEEIDRRMSVYKTTSDVTRVNESFPEAVPVGQDTFYVLETALHWARLSGGTFDITVYPLIQLWRQAAETQEWPNPERLARIRQSVGWRNVELLPNHRVRLNNPGTQVDLGGIAKGYALDEAARILRKRGWADFLMDAGGDLIAGGRNCQGEPWRLGVRHPRDGSHVMALLAVTDRAVTTSGDYERFFTIQGERFSHILNPLTGYPEKGAISATVIAPEAMTADALSTTLCVLPVRQGLAWINSLGEDIAAFVVLDRGDGLEFFASRNWDRWVLNDRTDETVVTEIRQHPLNE